jgi:predicted aminopeptidase
MSESLYFLALLACPVGMGVMMWMMMRMQGSAGAAAPESPAETTVGKQAELVKLRAEIDQLRAEGADRRGDSKPVGWAL